MIPTEQDCQRMIQAGESQFVEFKRVAVAPKHLAEDLVAFTNACPEPCPWLTDKFNISTDTQ